MKINKKGLQISFAWLFAIIVGAVILVLAIYLATKFIGIGQTSSDAETAKEIGVLLNPLEMSFESGKTLVLELPTDSRIYNGCNVEGLFGKQLIRVSQKSFGEWTETDINVGFSNKYIFSDRYVEGKKFYLFSKPFEFPFKVGDLIYMTSSLDNYCFIGAPKDIEDEIKDLKQANLFTENCPEDSIDVCFSDNPDCDIKVNYNVKYVDKQGEKLYFETDALMYAAIFSDRIIYECQVQRLMQRTKELALLYEDKAVFITRSGCYSNLNLVGLSSSAESLDSSYKLFLVAEVAEEIGRENKDSNCRLW